MSGELTLSEKIVTRSFSPTGILANEQFQTLMPSGRIERRTVLTRPDPNTVAVTPENGAPGIGVSFPSPNFGEARYARGVRFPNLHWLHVNSGPTKITIIGGEHRISNGHGQIVLVTGAIEEVWAYGENLKVVAPDVAVAVDNKGGARVDRELETAQYVSSHLL